MAAFQVPAVFWIAAILLVAGAWKLLLLAWDVVPFNSDEAVVALMARHIRMGARPVFFYGQAYMGSLDAFLVALGFSLFGEQVWVIRLVQALLYLGTLLTTAWIGRLAFQSWNTGLLAAGLLALPTVNVTLYTTASLGGYGEALLIGNLLLLSALRIKDHADANGLPWLLFLAWGALAGCGLWANGLTLVYSAPSGLYLLWALWKRRGMRRGMRRGWLAGFLLAAGLGFFLGSLPWWIYAIQNGPGRLILELLGTAIDVESDPWLVRTGKHLLNFLLLGTTALFGFRPPWAIQWLALPLAPFVLAFWLAVTGFFTRRVARPGLHRASYALLAGVCGVLLAGFLLTPFGNDPSGRYFLPLSVPLALVAAQMLLAVSAQVPAGARVKPAALAALLFVVVVAFQAWGTLQSALRYPPGLTTQFYEPTIIEHRADQALIDFLRSEGETRGYTNYWVAYPLAFRSGEEIIFVPRLPYHLDLRYTPRDDRYAPYTAAVDASPRVAYITTRNPALDAYLREQFRLQGIDWQETQIGDYQVYYRLSRAVRPGDIGLGELNE